MDKIDFYLGIIILIISIQWHAHFMKDSVSFIWDTLPAIIITIIIFTRLVNK